MKNETGMTDIKSRKNLIEDNPFVDVAAYLFLEDIADKQGASGMNNYLISLASSLARSMPEERYPDWESFMESVKRGESVISAFEPGLWCVSDNCIITASCPFEEGWREYTRRIGKFSPVHTEVADFYNSTLKPSVVDTTCIIHQTYRTEAVSRIMVDGNRVRVAQIAAVVTDGGKKIIPDEWKPILLEKAGITNTDLNMLLRNNSCIWVLYTE